LEIPTICAGCLHEPWWRLDCAYTGEF
jgi:hypothetical protein